MAIRSDGAAARAAAARVISAVAGGRSLDIALERVDDGLSPRDLAFVRLLANGTLRHWYSLGDELVQSLDRPLHQDAVLIDALLRAGIYQLRHLNTPAHAAVSASVSAARLLDQHGATGLVNAILKRVARQERPPVRSDDARYDHPKWLRRTIARDHPDGWRAIIAANNERAPMSLRVNLLQRTRADYLNLLARAGLHARIGTLSERAIVLDEPAPVERLPGFADGWCSVQDEAAQLAAALIAPTRGARILDACAAPGGKTGAILEVAPGARVDALDVDSQRLQSVADNLRRLRLHARILAGDARSPAAWWSGEPYDAILVDAPCSATGVIRRHPDAKLLHRSTDLPLLAQRQHDLLAALWPLLRNGGRLVYSTCSILHAENGAVIDAFIAGTADCRRATSMPQDLQLLPQPGGPDGFFYASLHKQPAPDAAGGGPA